MSVTKQTVFAQEIIETVKEQEEYEFVDFETDREKPRIKFEVDGESNTYFIHCNNPDWSSKPIYKISAPPLRVLSNCDKSDVMNWL